MLASVGTTVAVWFVVDQVRKRVAPKASPLQAMVIVGMTTIVANRVISKQMTKFVGGA
jgi:hypothetical protein